MRFASPLTEARLVRRYKRFLADVEFADGHVETVHVANAGAMLGLVEPGTQVFLSRSASTTRKLPWSWELASVEGGLVGIGARMAEPHLVVGEFRDVEQAFEAVFQADEYAEVRDLRDLALNELARLIAARDIVRPWIVVHLLEA